MFFLNHVSVGFVLFDAGISRHSQPPPATGHSRHLPPATAATGHSRHLCPFLVRLIWTRSRFIKFRLTGSVIGVSESIISDTDQLFRWLRKDSAFGRKKARFFFQCTKKVFRPIKKVENPCQRPNRLQQNFVPLITPKLCSIGLLKGSNRAPQPFR